MGNKLKVKNASIKVEEGLDIGKRQAYIKIEESCSAQTIKVKVQKIFTGGKKGYHLLGVEK